MDQRIDDMFLNVMGNLNTPNRQNRQNNQRRNQTANRNRNVYNQNISENSIKIPTTINLSLSSGAHFNNAYNNQAPIKITPKPPNS